MERFKVRNVRLIWSKELLDIVRDRRTLMSMIVVPLILMPLMMFGIGAIMTTSMKNLEEQSYSVGIVNAEQAPEFVKFLEGMKQTKFVDLGDNEAAAKTMVDNGDLQGAVILPSGGIGVGDGNPSQVTLMVRKNKERSKISMDRVKDRLADLRSAMTEERLKKIGAPENVLNPFEIKEENLASQEQMVASELATILPYMLILMSLTGAIYPAIDMTAGEKERGTLETLLASPAARLEIVLGKFFAITTTAIVSAVISLASLIAVITYGTTWIGEQVGATLSFSVSPLHILYAVLIMLPLAGMFAAALMTISIFAKSTREAQSYLTPLMFVVILPAMMSIIPGSETSVQKAWTPVVNVSLVLKDILNGAVDPVNLLIAVFSTTLYAGIAIAITVRVFKRENVLFRV